MIDASLRATILGSLSRLNREYGISILYITHDLTTAYQISQNIVVLYRGAVAELGEVGSGRQGPAAPLHAPARRLHSAARSRALVERRGGGLRHHYHARRWLQVRGPLSVRYGALHEGRATAVPHRPASGGGLLPL